MRVRTPQATAIKRLMSESCFVGVPPKQFI
jgi:hypothetical protein